MRPSLRRRRATSRTASSAPNGTTNWYWTNPRGPYMRFQSPDAVERVEEGGDASAARPVRARGALRNHSSLKAATVDGVEQARGRRDRHLRPATTRVEGEGVGASRPGEVVEPGVVAPGEHGPAHAAARGPGSRSTPPSTGSRSSPLGHPGHAVVEVRRPARCRPRMVAVSTRQHAAAWPRPRSRSGPCRRRWPRTGRGRCRARPRRVPSAWRAT